MTVQRIWTTCLLLGAISSAACDGALLEAVECDQANCVPGTCRMVEGRARCDCPPGYHFDQAQCVADAPAPDGGARSDAPGDTETTIEPTCTDVDGDYYIAERHTNPIELCGSVCGPSHDEVCQLAGDCDDADPAKTVAQDCEIPEAISGAYYVTNTGSGDHSGTTYGNAMSVVEHNGRTFDPGATIYIAEAIVVDRTLVVPSSGFEGDPITYRGDHPDHRGSMEQDLLGKAIGTQLQIENRQYINVINLDFRSNVGSEYDVHNRQAIVIHEWYEPTGHVTIEGCSFFETCTAIGITGDARYVNVHRSHFANMMDNGVWVAQHWSGSGYTAANRKPSFITVGGSRDNGNTFVNVARLNGIPASGEVPGQTFGTRADDAVFSYNHVYATDPLWGAGVYLNGVDRVLIENNYFHDLACTHRRPHVTIKSDVGLSNSDIVVRFNRITHSKGGDSYVGELGISIGNCADTAIVYGNYVHDAASTAISANWGWHSNVSDDGCGVTNYFVYSNVIARTQQSSGLYVGGSGSDTVENIYWTNNTIYRAVDDDTSTHTDNYAIHAAVGGDHNQKGMTIKNNIIDTPRDTSPKHIGISVNVQEDLDLAYNHHFFPDKVPLVYMDSASCYGSHLSANCMLEWNAPELPYEYGRHDSEGNPQYIDAANDNFSLTSESPCVNSGDALDVSIPAVQIQGKTYSFDIGDALDPIRTNWHALIPFVHTLKQSDHGSSWEKGAYVFPE